MSLSEPQHECWGIEERPMPRLSSRGAEVRAAKIRERMG